MKRLFLVCGPESAGNRLVAVYLARAGVDIDASTNEQLPERVTVQSRDVGLIVHHEPKLSRTVQLAQSFGRSVLMVVLVREYVANIRSMIARGHVDTAARAAERIRLSHLAALSAASRYGLPFVAVSYESLVLHPRETVENLLNALELRTDNLDSPITVQGEQCPPEAENRNARRYA